MSEHLHQVSAVNWFRDTYPGVLIFAIPNGGMRNPMIAAKMRREGVTPGVPDLFIPEWRLFVEMKDIGGRTSKEQREMIAELQRVGYQCEVCQGFEAFKEVVTKARP